MTLKHFNIENGRVFVIASYLLTNFHNSFRFFIIIQHSFQGSHPKVSTPKNCSELVLNYMIKYNTIKKECPFLPTVLLLLAKPNLCNKILVLSSLDRSKGSLIIQRLFTLVPSSRK